MNKLFLYLISQKENTDYDAFDSAIVCAESSKEAKRTFPAANRYVWIENEGWYWLGCDNTPTQKEMVSNWANNLSNIKVTKIGEAEQKIKKGVVLASFNAG